MDGPSSRVRLFEEVMLPHLDSAFNLARWLTRDERDAEDVVQEAYLRALRFFDSFTGGDGKAWLLTIVRNTYLTRRRREGEFAKIAFDETIHSSREAANAELTLVRKGAMDSLKTCVESLPPEYREVLVMRELEEMPYKEIAQTVSLPIGTVMSRLSRARKRLQNCMAASVERIRL